MALRITKRVDRFPLYIKAAPKVARELEEKHVKDWVYVMKAIMNVDTGFMRDHTEAVPNTTNRGWGVRIGAWYWRFPNDGTVYYPGSHFVEESREIVRPNFKKDLRRFIPLVRAAA